MNDEEKRNLLTTKWWECRKNHLCGDYIHINGQDLQWGVEMTTEHFQLICHTDNGIYKLEYDFDFDFDTNLQSFFDGLQEYLEDNQCVY